MERADDCSHLQNFDCLVPQFRARLGTSILCSSANAAIYAAIERVLQLLSKYLRSHALSA